MRDQNDKSTAPVRSERELADDLLLICQYRKQRMGWRSIAEKINSQRDYELGFTVYYRQYHRSKSNIEKEAMDNKDDLIMAELSEIDWQISQLMIAWENSIGTMERTKTKGIGESKEEEVTTWEQNGDPRYMAEITKLRERRCKLLGLDAPEKHAITAEVQVVKIPDNGR